jgi:hypothetical protein
MSLQELFRTAAELEQFERIALQAGYKNFNKTGRYYNHADLNTFAQGYVAGRESLIKQSAVA